MPSAAMTTSPSLALAILAIRLSTVTPFVCLGIRSLPEDAIVSLLCLLKTQAQRIGTLAVRCVLREPINPIDGLAVERSLARIARAVILEKRVDHSACGTILSLGLSTVDPSKHHRRGGAIAVLSLTLVSGALQELAYLDVHLIDVVVDVVGPQIKIGKLDRNFQRRIRPEPLDDVIVWIPTLVFIGYRCKQFGCIQQSVLLSQEINPRGIISQNHRGIKFGPDLTARA